MYDISIKIDKKKHIKTDATLQDYINMTEYNEKYKGQSFLNSKDTVLDAVKLIADWFGDVTVEEIQTNLTLKEIIDIYRQIESNITEVFTGVPLKKALRELRQAQREILSTQSED